MREAALPTLVAILLGLFGVGVLVAVAFASWRLLGTLRRLVRSIGELSAALTPLATEVAEAAARAAEQAAAISGRAAAPPD